MDNLRTTTNKLLELIDIGLLDARTVALACMKYMGEDEVADMANVNSFLDDEEYGEYDQTEVNEFNQDF